VRDYRREARSESADKREDDADDIEVEEEFWYRELICLSPTVPEIIGHNLQMAAEPAQSEHKHEEGAILCDRNPQPS
jgi:hypothetical protein